VGGRQEHTLLNSLLIGFRRKPNSQTDAISYAFLIRLMSPERFFLEGFFYFFELDHDFGQASAAKGA
jgi:hypothetical protein